MKIVIYEAEEWEKSAFDALVGDHQIKFVDKKAGEGAITPFADAEVISPFIYSKLTADTLEKSSYIKCRIRKDERRNSTY